RVSHEVAREHRARHRPRWAARVDHAEPEDDERGTRGRGDEARTRFHRRHARLLGPPPALVALISPRAPLRAAWRGAARRAARASAPSATSARRARRSDRRGAAFFYAVVTRRG